MFWEKFAAKCTTIANVHFFCFAVDLPLWPKFGTKNQNFLFKKKYSSQTNSEMLSLMVMFIFLTVNERFYWWGIFGPKSQNIQFKIKLSAKINCNILNSAMLSTFYVSYCKEMLGKFCRRNQNWRRNVVLTLIQPIWGKFAPKNQNYIFK